MSKPYTPRPYAELAMAHFRDNPRCALWAGMGMGKSVMVLTHLDLCYRVWGDSHPTLILGPLRVAGDVWPREAAKWDHLRGLDVIPVVGTEAERIAALRLDAPIYTTNYENLPWLREHLGGRWPFRRIVPDEATRLKNFRLRQGGARAAVLGAIAHTEITEVIELTGTPSPNGLKDLWGQMYFLDAGERLGRSYSGFEERYFAWRWVKDALSKKSELQQIMLPHAYDLIHEKLKGLCLTLDPRDWFDLHEPIVNVIEVDMPPPARRVYKDLEKDMFARIGEHEVEAFNAAALTMKCLQVANGAVYTDEKAQAWAPLHDAKLEALDSILEETGAPVLVAYHFRSDRERILKRFPDALDIATKAGLAAAQRGEGRLWLGHPASIGHGIDGLQEHCNTVAVFGHWWDLEQFDQLFERVGPVRQMQAGKDRAVTLHLIVARKTIDTAVVARRGSKRGVQDALLNYMKGTP